MKILLLYPSWTAEYGLMSYFAKRAGVWPPLGLALLGAIAEQKGHEVKILDGEVERFSLDELIKQSIEYKPDLIGLTGRSPFFHITKELAVGLKKANNKIPIVVGGQHVTILKEKALLPVFDVGFVGDAEKSWAKFLESYKTGGDLSDITGLVFRKNNEICYTGQEAVDDNLDLLPFPARHLLNMGKYKLGTLEGMKNFTSIQSTRGCPWKCIFCSSKDLNTSRISRRSPLSVINEIKEVIDKFNIRHFMFIDDVLTLNRKHILTICDLIEKENLSITFEGSTRANLVDENLIVKMKKAGLKRLSFGLETVDLEMRKTMNKKVPIEAYIEANKILNKYDIEALNSVMLGLPGETRETIKKTINFLKISREVKQANFAIAVPYPGTEFYRMAKSGEHGVKLMTDDFSQYRRYGSAVTTINELTPKDLIDLQNDGFVSIYAAPWRWKPMFKKSGFIGCLLTFMRLIKLIIRKVLNRCKPFSVYPGQP